MPDFQDEDTKKETAPASNGAIAPRHSQPDPRERPADPAGSKPRVDPESLLPSSDVSLLHHGAPPADIDAVGVEIPLDDGELLPAHRPSSAPAPSGAGAGVPPHAGRFGFALGALLAIAAAGVMLAVLVIGDNNSDNGPSGPQWSAWQPSKDAGDGPKQIAAHVGALYRLQTGRQMVLVKSSSLKVSGVDLDVAIRPRPTDHSDIKIVKGDKTVMFRMCGLDTATQDCSIPGTPSQNRAFLVRREALELALYTFHYTDAKGVVVLFPPIIQAPNKDKLTPAEVAKAQRKRVAAYFQRGDLKKSLSGPLTATLTPRTPTVAEAANWPDAGTVNRMTSDSLYTFGLSSGNTENKGYLVLDEG